MGRPWISNWAAVPHNLRMPIPSRDQQIIQTHAAFICQSVEFMQRNDARAQFDALMQAATHNGWTALAAAVRKMAGGLRDLNLIQGLDEEDRVVAEAILRGLQDPASLPDPNQKADPSLAAPGLAHMIHAAATGDVQALTLVSQMAEQMSKAGGDMARLAALIRPLINGERDPDRLCAKLDTRGQQLVLGILAELAQLAGH